MSTELEERLRILAASDDMTTTRRELLLAAADVVATIEAEHQIIAALDASLSPPLERGGSVQRLGNQRVWLP